jgi:hypothetical protein
MNNVLSIGEAQIKLDSGWTKLEEKVMPSTRAVLAKPDSAEYPVIHYELHRIELDDLNTFQALLNCKAVGDLLLPTEVSSLAFILKERSQPKFRASLQRDTLAGRDGIVAWIANEEKHTYSWSFLYVTAAMGTKLIEEIGCEGTPVDKLLWKQGLQAIQELKWKPSL